MTELPGAHVIIVSDRAYRGERPDATGGSLVEALEAAGFAVPDPKVTLTPDEPEYLATELERIASDPRVRLVLTSGGTGAAPRDCTPEATRAVIERELPGFGELMRARSFAVTPFAAGSRAIAGTLGKTLIINLPGSPKGALECFGFVRDAARHVVELLRGEATDCAPPGGP